METPKEKAKTLVEGFANDLHGNAIESNRDNKYRCAMRCTEEIVYALKEHGDLKAGGEELRFWYDVQVEIQKQSGFLKINNFIV